MTVPNYFVNSFLYVPIPDGLAPSTSAQQRFAGVIPRPPAPPSFAAPARLVVPNVRPVRAGEPSTSSSSIYYPSQDPTRLGAKGDVID
uniref:Uncharacterized protein n=1 Tax=Caenorhabditis japonica TaxID=281687 RepID=A0A8R1IXA6_CAEJA